MGLDVRILASEEKLGTQHGAMGKPDILVLQWKPLVEVKSVGGGLSWAVVRQPSIIPNIPSAPPRNGHGKLPPLRAAPPGQLEKREKLAQPPPPKGLEESFLDGSLPCPWLGSGRQ
ncbi:hypothetical protein P7K49_030476 [Saguinus oedipus]|uniref:Uncharacterized protein n=1 Tax=Saguinus oedipus TaxID=9490 RepID=A0ABQ9U4A5_SAGOE|nr:hypothetical protein P7K49_030476 [Saguinus oedipus]